MPERPARNKFSSLMGPIVSYRENKVLRVRHLLLIVPHQGRVWLLQEVTDFVVRQETFLSGVASGLSSSDNLWSNVKAVRIRQGERPSVDRHADQHLLLLTTSEEFFFFVIDTLVISSGNTKRGSITVLLTSCLTGLQSGVWLLTIFVFICKTDKSKPVKQEVDSTVILHPLVFPDFCINIRAFGTINQYWTGLFCQLLCWKLEPLDWAVCSKVRPLDCLSVCQKKFR